MSEIYDVLPDLKLYLNIEHPDYEECYEFGYLCAQAEVKLENNPYTHNTRLAEQWDEGWWDGFYGHEPVFAIEPQQSTEINNAVIAKVTAANAANFNDHPSYLKTILTITGTIAATMWVGYQLLEWAA